MKVGTILPVLVVFVGSFGCAPKPADSDATDATGGGPASTAPSTPTAERDGVSGQRSTSDTAVSSASNMVGDYKGSFIPGSAVAEGAQDVTKNELKLAEGGRYEMALEYKNSKLNTKSEGSWKQEAGAVILTPAKINGTDIPAGQSQPVRFQIKPSGLLENTEAGLRFERR